MDGDARAPFDPRDPVETAKPSSHDPPFAEDALWLTARELATRMSESRNVLRSTLTVRDFRGSNLYRRVGVTERPPAHPNRPYH